MTVILGIDIGTSSVKAMLLDKERGVINTVNKNYEVSIPGVGMAEQSPELWWNGVVTLLQQLRLQNRQEFAAISAVGFSGQMHGLVAVDINGNVLRPAILWLDQRTSAQLELIKGQIRSEEMGEILHNRVFTGFAFPSLLWIRDQEPEIYHKIHKIMQPKDFIRYKMTGCIGTDVSDASATAIFHTGKRTWAYEFIDRFSINREIFPECHESTEICGEITQECETLTGLKAGTPAVFGSGDQQAQSVGNGAVREGLIISNIGTGGQISTYLSEDQYDPYLRTHTFCHAVDRAYTIFGATLCSGMSLNWLKNKVLKIGDFNELSQMAAEISPCSEGLLYLPYLSGERTPHMDSHAKGMFFGLKLCHDNRHFARAVMEGVTFSLKDSLEIFGEMGIRGKRIIASGGGASSEVWLQIQADIFGQEVQVCSVKEQACLGACIIAGTGTGIFKNVQEACDRYIQFDSKIYTPNHDLSERYRESYFKYKTLYDRVKDLF